MKLSIALSICIAVLAFLAAPSPVAAQDEPEVAPAETSSDLCECIPVSIEAPMIESVGDFVRASGGLVLRSHKRRITASEAEYNMATATGVFENVTFTTCCRETKPDYRIEAREVTLLEGNRLRARGVSVYLGRLKVLALPSMKLRLGGATATTQVFPRPSFSKDEGLSVAQKLVLADSDRLRAMADLRLSTGHGIQGEVHNILGIDGKLTGFPGRFLTYESLRSNALTMHVGPENPCSETDEREPPDTARLRQFGVFSLNQETYSVRDTGLLVFRQPEVGLQYIGRQLGLAGARLHPRLEIYPELTASWGRFRESPGQVGFTDRSRFGLLTGINLISFGPYTAIQPAVEFSVARYGTGDTYTTSAYGIDASHLSRNGSLTAVRYINRRESGRTPFEFDRVQVFREIQGAVQTRVGRWHTLGLVAGYDLDRESVYDWGVLYGYRTDCIATSLSWRNLERKISFDVRLIAK